MNSEENIKKKKRKGNLIFTNLNYIDCVNLMIYIYVI